MTETEYTPRLNTKLIGFDGLIGRYDFFYNKALILFISSFIYIPLFLWILLNIDLIAMNAVIGKLLIHHPFVLMFTLLSCVYITLLDFGNAKRRITDIAPKINSSVLYGIAVYTIFSDFSFLFLTLDIYKEVLFIKIVFDIVLMCICGKITVNYPHDFTKRFNLGAFFGTWIWGLINKSYITLWQLILFFTPACIPFALICGIKGNEWAYKNKKYNQPDDFLVSQKKQSDIFTIIAVCAIPIFYVTFLFGLFTLTTRDVKDPAEKFNVYFEKTYIDSYEITDDKNIIYIEADYWRGLDMKERMDFLEMAARFSADKREKADIENNNQNRRYYSWSRELQRTRIYSSEKHELLAKFEEQIDKNKTDITLKDAFKEALGFKFYEPSR